MRGGSGSGLRWLGRGLAACAAVALFAAGVLVVTNGEHAAASGSPVVEPAPGVSVGKSGLPIPRFVSLKAKRVNVRVGPGEDYNILWVFTRPALPVEVVQEFDTWRRVRDSDGQVGWVFHSLLSAKRTAVVSPWTTGEPLPIRAKGSAEARITAYLQPGVTASVDRCRGGWCDLYGEGFSGWIRQEQLWGVYPDEEVD